MLMRNLLTAGLFVSLTCGSAMANPLQPGKFVPFGLGALKCVDFLAADRLEDDAWTSPKEPRTSLINSKTELYFGYLEFIFGVMSTISDSTGDDLSTLNNAQSPILILDYCQNHSDQNLAVAVIDIVQAQVHKP
jgi:hypothetical protein